MFGSINNIGNEPQENRGRESGSRGEMEKERRRGLEKRGREKEREKLSVSFPAALRMPFKDTMSQMTWV
jgi:hypothetical protein